MLVPFRKTTHDQSFCFFLVFVLGGILLQLLWSIHGNSRLHKQLTWLVCAPACLRLAASARSFLALFQPTEHRISLLHRDGAFAVAAVCLPCFM